MKSVTPDASASLCHANSFRFLRSFAFLLCCAAIAFCIVYLDRRIADSVRSFMWTTPWYWLRRIVGAFGAAAALLVAWLVGCGLWAGSRRLPPWTETPLLCGWSVALSLAVEAILKRVFGRFAPNPEYILNHVYGFRLLHGVIGEDAFPSGTAMIASALVAVVFLRANRVARVAVYLALAICIATVITNTHWLGDVVGGCFVGAVIGTVTVRLVDGRTSTHGELKKGS